MATLRTTALVSNNPINPSAPKRYYISKNSVNCALSTPRWRESRRLFHVEGFPLPEVKSLFGSLSENSKFQTFIGITCNWVKESVQRIKHIAFKLALDKKLKTKEEKMRGVTQGVQCIWHFKLYMLSNIFFPADAFAGSFLDKYVKRKRLDPLEAYIPAVILTEFQIKDLEKTLEDEQPQFANCRSLLRSGPAASLRVNIRAVAQYASEAGKGNTAFNDVDLCLRALEDLDSLLLHASRKDQEASIESMKAKIGVALNALDSLLQTIPSDVLDKGKAVADAYRAPIEEEVPESTDPELKQLESIL